MPTDRAGRCAGRCAPCRAGAARATSTASRSRSGSRNGCGLRCRCPSPMDLLLSHGYFLAEDKAEQKIMRPYPPLGLLYVASHLKARGFAVSVFDSTFRTYAEFAAFVARERPPVVGLYCNLMTKANVLRL